MAQMIKSLDVKHEKYQKEYFPEKYLLYHNEEEKIEFEEDPIIKQAIRP